MSGRDAVLAAVRRAVAGLELSAEERRPFAPQRFADPVAAFAENLEAAGGTCRPLADGEALEEALATLPVVASATRCVSALDALPSTLPEAAGPRDLTSLDLAVLAGAPAVVESGAVWVVPGSALERAALFLAEHVVLVVPREALVPTLHEAYPQVTPIGGSFACFVAGPSKTADIEQALVIGAHGPRSLCVVLA